MWTAMQVGLATNQLKGDPNFMAASCGFSVFAILGLICDPQIRRGASVLKKILLTQDNTFRSSRAYKVQGLRDLGVRGREHLTLMALNPITVQILVQEVALMASAHRHPLACHFAGTTYAELGGFAARESCNRVTLPQDSNRLCNMPLTPF